MGTYYVAPVKKKDSIHGKPIVARGKLVDKAKNVLYKSGEGVPLRERKKREAEGYCSQEDQLNTKRNNPTVITGCHNMIYL